MRPKRIFAAIDVNDAVKTRIAEYSGQLRDEFAGAKVRWQQPEKFHITLRFEPKADKERLAQVSERAKEAAFSVCSFNAVVAGTGAFVRRQGPAVLWLGVAVADGSSPVDPFARMAGLLSNMTKVQRFHAHLTIGRIKHLDPAAEVIKHHNECTFGPVPFAVDTIVVYESILTPAGSIYTPLERHRLRAIE